MRHLHCSLWRELGDANNIILVDRMHRITPLGTQHTHSPAVGYLWKMVIASKHETLFRVLRTACKLSICQSCHLKSISVGQGELVSICGCGVQALPLCECVGDFSFSDQRLHLYLYSQLNLSISFFRADENDNDVVRMNKSLAYARLSGSPIAIYSLLSAYRPTNAYIYRNELLYL